MSRYDEHIKIVGFYMSNDLESDDEPMCKSELKVLDMFFDIDDYLEREVQSGTDLELYRLELRHGKQLKINFS